LNAPSQAEKGSIDMSGRDDIKESDLEQYGVERVPADVFLWGGYRYSSARDAVAAAKRAAKP
jgi:hypothetical protein